MAEIKIEKKKPIWPWVLLILLILAAIFFFWYYNDRNLNSNDDVITRDTITHDDSRYQTDNDNRYKNDFRDTTSLYSGSYGTVQKEQAFADYFNYLDNKDNTPKNREYYRSAFFKLITATKREAEIENVDVSSNVTAAMNSAEKMTNDPTKSNKADNLKTAANEVSKALKSIQTKEFDNLGTDIESLDKAVSEIDGSQTLENQTSKIDSFFDKAARVLQKMNENQSNY